MKVVYLVSSMHRPLQRPTSYPWYSFLLRGQNKTKAIVWPEGLSQWKNPPTPSTIKPATYQTVKQSVNQQRHCITQSRHRTDTVYLYSTASNLILPILQNKTLMEGFKEKSRDKTSNLTSYTSCQTLCSENPSWFPSSSLCLLLLQLPCCCYSHSISSPQHHEYYIL